MVSKRVVSADVPPEQKPERGHVRQNRPFTKPPFYLPVTLFGVDKRVVSKRVVSADVPRDENSGPEKGVITKGVFSLAESLESLKSLDSLESLENGQILLYFPGFGVL